MNFQDGSLYNPSSMFTGSMAVGNPQTTSSASVIDNLIAQIKAQGTSSKWTGTVNSDVALRGMAKALADQGITNINQVGMITQTGIEEDVRPDGRGGFIDKRGNRVDPSLVKPVEINDESGQYTSYTAPIGTQQTIGNKETGQPLTSGYQTSEKTAPNMFGGTTEGKGGTSYNVQFDQAGNPIFYSNKVSSGGAGTLGFGLKLALAGAGLSGLEGLLGGGSISGDALASQLGGETATAEGLLSNTVPMSATVPEVASIAPSVAPEVTGMGAGTGITGGTSGLGLQAGTSGLGTSGIGTGVTSSGLTGSGVLSGSTLGTGLLGTTGTTGLTGTGILSGSTLGTGLLGTGANTAATVGGVGNTMANLGTGALNTGVGSALGSAAGSTVASLFGDALTLGGGLLQQQTSREAAQKAQAMIDAETAAAKQAAQFRPVGMTTRFGTSQFQFDPTTGQMVSAGYTLTPEAKAQQDRLVALQNQGLTQAEQAQAQFAPLQTGAQSMFNLGNQYLAQSPQDVAQNYLNQQLALLQPGRELELANLQNKLQQQGRSGLSVAQGGSYGATTPELQALYNARAMQEAQLAAQAQQAGQQQVQFGAGLLGQGAGAMGQYYSGQQAAYSPYTTALGQVQALEAAGQQPLTMSTNLGQTAAQAGANVGQLGLSGARLSTALATSDAATTNPYATVLGGLGSSQAFGTAAGNVFGRLFS